ncbi:hypothetical protein BZG36_00846 [Bifiguratus adelaidae]|uniref:Semialdehyde dehydrogenase NAD-binding domain-containing protein n=1 Tax=Bifiguratus adelaidae TaxID=1938954 RepID=A0A261Y6M9_9FUNG|nr:hypothetical protein BZG36_00846 [Bifiguratus adelaidae]
MSVLILGGTGAVGKTVVRQCLERNQDVTVVGRRPVELADENLSKNLIQKTINFEDLENHRADFKGYDVVFCCLGTTRADAGGAEQFKKIDHDYVVNTAKIIAEENPAEGEGKLSPVHYLYCSSMGANANSMLLYPQTKGRTENDLADIGFTRVSIFRPGLLKIEEPRRTSRFGEGVALKLSGWLEKVGMPAAAVSAVGKAMIEAALGRSAGVKPEKDTRSNGTEREIFSNPDILKLAAII